ncbi:hypothetical protein [Dactylosporangium sp. NPDC050588]|uniref:hypothetical protein n=1 Tax=Dactylosporangium sp. NPDC050588 TaxID=3157211 RepID=UPI0033DE4D63
MSESERPAWKSTARALVLYNPKGEWRFAVYHARSTSDGVLVDVPDEAAPAVAQAQLM